MTFQLDDLCVSHQFLVGEGYPTPHGIGPTKIRGSAYVESPMNVGSDKAFPGIWASLMVGPMKNKDSPPAVIPGYINACGPHNHSPYALAVIGDAAIFQNLDVNRNIAAGNNIKAGGNIVAQGHVMSHCGGHVLAAKKNFDIPHPTKKGWRLAHSCVEGPEAAVYVRGKVVNKTEINLPEYWINLVDPQSITVSITPIGAHQDIIVKRIGDNKVYLQAKGGIPINCFYHVFGERIDTEKLIPEYEGTIEDYPGDNTQRSIVGYHYDVRNNKE